MNIVDFKHLFIMNVVNIFVYNVEQVSTSKFKRYNELYERLGTKEREKYIDWLRLDKNVSEISNMYVP